MKTAIVDIVTGERTEFPSRLHVEFGEGADRVTIMVRDGDVEISTKSAMSIFPRSSNVIFVRGTR